MELRLTFRDKVDICWQKQLRDKFNAEGIPPVPYLDLKRAVVLPVSRELAKQIIYKYEWLGTMSPTRFHYGIFFGMFCAGVTCCGYNIGGGAMTPKMFGVNSKDVLYLARGANVHWSPAGANSKLVSMTCKMLKRETDGKIVIAYSDTDAGEIGTIYQACNWIYVGVGAEITQWVSKSGRAFNQMLPRDLSRTRGGTRIGWVNRLRVEGWREQRSNPKHRYVYILDRTDKRLIDKVEAMRQPYPKRGTGETDNAAHSHAQTGGASPTVPLLNHGN